MLEMWCGVALAQTCVESFAWCRAANTATASGNEGNEKLQLQLRQAQQMAAAVARKKDDMMAKLKRLTDKQVGCLADLQLAVPVSLVVAPYGSCFWVCWPARTC